MQLTKIKSDITKSWKGYGSIGCLINCWEWMESEKLVQPLRKKNFASRCEVEYLKKKDNPEIPFTVYLAYT